jgi:hypothetical protein
MGLVQGISTRTFSGKMQIKPYCALIQVYGLA